MGNSARLTAVPQTMPAMAPQRSPPSRAHSSTSAAASNLPNEMPPKVILLSETTTMQAVSTTLIKSARVRVNSPCPSEKARRLRSRK